MRSLEGIINPIAYTCIWRLRKQSSYILWARESSRAQVDLVAKQRNNQTLFDKLCSSERYTFIPHPPPPLLLPSHNTTPPARHLTGLTSIPIVEAFELSAWGAALWLTEALPRTPGAFLGGWLGRFGVAYSANRSVTSLGLPLLW